MMLWDIIRDWFVQYVFGGITSSQEQFGGVVGEIAYWDPENGFDGFEFTTAQYAMVKSGIYDGLSTGELGFMTLGDWLSTTATVITLIALCLFLFLAVKWVFNIFRNTLERVGK